ncbi:transposable element Tcb2 transposase [Trichonephila clavipes]|nr:transposable element Tcb2 transposase [Trichonephila clavipes]
MWFFVRLNKVDKCAFDGLLRRSASREVVLAAAPAFLNRKKPKGQEEKPLTTCPNMDYVYLSCLRHVRRSSGTAPDHRPPRLDSVAESPISLVNSLVAAFPDRISRNINSPHSPPRSRAPIFCGIMVPFYGIWSRFLETGSAGRRPGQGRRRETTPNEDRYLVLTAQRHLNMNTALFQQNLRSATNTTVSTQTVRNRLHGVGLYARRPMFCFSVHPDNRRIFIWRDRGSKNNPALVHESVRFNGGGVFVYFGISIDGRTDLYIIRDGHLTARRYRDEILKPIVVLYAATIGDDIILIDDNCRPHRANLVEDFLFEERIVRIEWPACSPDMNPIEHV